MAQHLIFAGNTHECYCPVTKHYEERLFHGDTGPSEPTCSGCNQLLETEDLVQAHHVWTETEWNCKGTAVEGQSGRTCVRCGETVRQEVDWTGYPEDDGYVDNPVEYNFWDDRTHGGQ